MRIVVDTSVAKAAGTGHPDAGPPSPACVAVLNAITEGGHGVVFNEILWREWQRHARPHAMKWLATMRGRRRFSSLSELWPGEPALLSAAADLPGNQPAEIAKDAHQVGLAMLTDRRVVSLDTTQRALLRKLLPQVPELGPLHWASPAEAPTVTWLAAGAPDEPRLQLGASS